MSEKQKKVYDYNVDRVRDKLISVFRSRRNEATVADLIGATGLPAIQVQSELPAVSDEYGARLRVTESGEILYSFPQGMKSRYKGLGHSLKRFWKGATKIAATVGKAVFKVWIVVMLVGYFALFLALALFALVASVAVSQGGGSSDSRSSSRRGGGLGGLWLTTRLFDTIIRIWFYSELFKSPEDRARSRGLSGFGRPSGDSQKRPLHKAVFSHVFGEGDPDAAWAEAEKKAVLAYLQSNRGIITLPEFMSITGLDPAGAETAINRYMLEFGGMPEVTEGGSIYYSFPELLRRTDTADRTFGFSTLLKRMAAFSSNSKKADTTFRLINLANILFGGYFLYSAATVGTNWAFQTSRGLALRGGLSYFYSMTSYLFDQIIGIANPVAFITWVLGVAPLAFSALFFLIPVLRSVSLEKRNEKARVENLRRIAYRAIWDHPAGFRPESIAPGLADATPKNPGAAASKIVDEVAAWSGADVAADGSFNFEAIARTRKEVQEARSTVKPADFELGSTVFDSHS